MSSAPNPEGVPPGAPVVPQGPVPAVGVPNSQDYPRLVYTAPRFEVVAIADIIEPSVLEACEALLPTLVPPYVNQAAIDAVNATAVRRAGDTMTGPLNLSPVIPTADAMAASKQYVDTMIATGTVPEVPPVPSGQAWARETGQWVPIAGGGTVTNIATGAGLTGGPITATGTIAMANMAGNTLKGNNTGAVAPPTDIPAGTVLTMIGGAPLNSPNFTGAPSLPTGTTGVTQSGGTSNTTLATTAFVANTVANYAPLVSPAFTGAPSLPTGTVGVTQAPGDADTSIATTGFVAAAIAPLATTAQLANYLPLSGGVLAGPGNLTVRGGILGGAAGTVPSAGSMLLNANANVPPAGNSGQLYVVGPGPTAQIGVDAFGTGGVGNAIVARRSRGTAAPGGQTAVQTGDNLLVLYGTGYGASAYGAFNASALALSASENWTASANGTQLVVTTTTNGGTALVNSLTLQGPIATFAGNIALGGFGNNISWAGTANGYLTTSASEISYVSPSTTGTANLHHWYSQTPTLTAIALLDGAGNFQIVGATATKASGTTWANPSSRDLKENIQPYATGLDAILALQPRTYSFNGTGGLPTEGTYIGLVHDETLHMPELHTSCRLGGGADDPGEEYDALDCSPITFALINAVKELSARLTALEGRTA